MRQRDKSHGGRLDDAVVVAGVVELAQGRRRARGLPVPSVKAAPSGDGHDDGAGLIRLDVTEAIPNG